MRRLAPLLSLFLAARLCAASGSDWQAHQPQANLSSLIVSGNGSVSGSLTAGSVVNTGTGATYALQNGVINMLMGSSFPAQSSGVTITSVVNYSLAQSTSGTNGNHIFNNSSGDFVWLTHNNCASGASGCIALPTGLHQDESFGLFVSADVATPHPVKLYHYSSTMSEPMIEIEAETSWPSDYYAGLGSPVYGGTFSGDAFRFRKRNVTLAQIDSAGSFWSWADATDYARFYAIDNVAGGLKANLAVFNWSETGSYIGFSSALGGNLLTVVAESGDVAMTPSGGDLNFTGNFNTVAVATQTIAGGNTITADSCGGTKRISSAGAVTTNTTDTFTALGQGFQCEMKVCNVGANNITLDRNAKTFLAAAGDLVLAANACALFSFDGNVWRQQSAALTAS